METISWSGFSRRKSFSSSGVVEGVTVMSAVAEPSRESWKVRVESEISTLSGVPPVSSFEQEKSAPPRSRQQSRSRFMVCGEFGLVFVVEFLSGGAEPS